MTLFKEKSVRNQELEKLREECTGPPDIDKIIHELIEKSKHIHASHLFDGHGQEVLQELCLQLSSTKPSHLYSGWQDFGHRLGLKKVLLECLRYNFQNQDPTFYTLLAFAQSPQSYLSTIIEALNDIKRYDVILSVQEKFADMCGQILNSGHTFVVALPNVPFIMQDINRNDVHRLDGGNKIKQIQYRFDDEQKESLLLLKAQCLTPRRNVYDKKIFLTFASDGRKIAGDLIEKLRKPRNDKRLGVLVLYEHTDKLCLNPQQFIYDGVLQVDYIVPIITRGYLEKISSEDDHDSFGDVDSKYAKYIYSLMLNRYVKNGCRNKNIRCVIPDDDLRPILKHYKMCQPVFQVWIKLSETDKFIDILFDL